MAALTIRQYTVLQTLRMGRRMTARQIGVRADVLWRLEERGLVGRNMHDQWRIRPDGVEAVDAEADRLAGGK
jgi:hypothetical protein